MTPSRRRQTPASSGAPRPRCCHRMSSSQHLVWQHSYAQEVRKPNAMRFTLDEFEVEITLFFDECANETDDE
ncbi:hypothetical protein [Bradyrhizobium sp. UFLA05-112]